MENSKQLQDKKVFITGGASGIGKAIVQAYCIAGADVTFCDIKDHEASELCAKLQQYKCSYINVDVSDEGQLSEVFQQLLNDKKGIDILINNVGVGNFKPIIDLSVEEFDKVLDINLRPVFILSKLIAMFREKHEAKFGRIINLASTRYLMSEAGTEAYSASKGAIVSLTHALAISLSKYNITVNCISPGWIETEDYSQLKAIDHSQHPSNRVGKPEDIARMCIYLSQPENDFVNGQNFVIDGGMTKKMIYEE